MKKILLLIMVLMPFISKAVTLSWNMGVDPSTLTVNGRGMGAVSKIVILDVTLGFQAEKFMDQVIFESKAAWDSTKKNVFTEEGKNSQFGLNAEKLMFAVVDADGNYFASSVMSGYTIAFYPQWALQEDGSKSTIKHSSITPFTPDAGWAVSGQVPEPTTLAAILLGATFMLARRKKQA